jgi:hypothetical protein
MGRVHTALNFAFVMQFFSLWNGSVLLLVQNLASGMLKP